MGSQCRLLSKGEAGHFTVVVAIMEAQPEEEAWPQSTQRRGRDEVKSGEMRSCGWGGRLGRDKEEEVQVEPQGCRA